MNKPREFYAYENIDGTGLKIYNECIEDYHVYKTEFHLIEKSAYDELEKQLKDSSTLLRIRDRQLQTAKDALEECMEDYETADWIAKEALEKIEGEKCPYCPNTGMIYTAAFNPPEQCEFCYTNPNSVFNNLSSNSQATGKK